MSRTPGQPSRRLLAALSVGTALWLGLTAPSLSPVAAPAAALPPPGSRPGGSGQVSR